MGTVKDAALAGVWPCAAANVAAGATTAVVKASMVATAIRFIVIVMSLFLSSLQFIAALPTLRRIATRGTLGCWPNLLFVGQLKTSTAGTAFSWRGGLRRGRQMCALIADGSAELRGAVRSFA